MVDKRDAVNWQPIALWTLLHIKAIFVSVGFTGSGVGIIKLMKHWPAPKKKNAKMGAIFDTIQDVLSNNERIGQRSDADSAFVTKTEAGGKTASAQTVTEPAQPAAKE